MEVHEDIMPRVQLRDNNVALIDSYRDIYAPKAHPGSSANLGHGPRHKPLAFFMQLSSTDLLALSVPLSWNSC
jgi:hypothetical protein